ncbi:MAG: cobalamin biosynthesis protein CobD [Bacteroidales bacterium]|nr:cobalamin biosynthesis protein CobD [Bacteroidales bacterium]
MTRLVSTVAGWLMDFALGDPAWLPHPIVGFGKLIAAGQKWLNRGKDRRVKGALMAIFLIAATAAATWGLLYGLQILGTKIGAGVWLRRAAEAILIFFCLAGTTLIKEVKEVFLAVDRSLEEGRRQVARIVGRDTARLSAQEIRTAALETLAENLNDGVIAPLFWLMLLGVPGMMAYKMINTLDSMIGYCNERYKDFGRFAAKTDDVAGWIPARLTALLMLVVSGNLNKISVVHKEGQKHLSPNSGHPEAALATILDCRFGGPHDYFGVVVYTPYIGANDREITTSDMHKAVLVNRLSEFVMVSLVCLVQFVCAIFSL